MRNPRHNFIGLVVGAILSTQACAGGGAEQRPWEEQGTVNDVNNRFSMYGGACDQGSVVYGCHSLIWGFDARQDGRGILRPTLAALGDKYEKGDGVGADPLLARDLRLRACSAGDAVSCGKLGLDLPPEATTAQAVGAALKEKCAGSSQPHCGVLGEAGLFKLLGVTEDSKGAVDMMLKACNAGSHDTCLNLGRMYQQGRGVKKDHKQAAKLASKACAAGIGAGCVVEANARFAMDDREEAIKAKELFKKQCDANDGTACHEYGAMVLLSKGNKSRITINVQKSNVKEALEYFNKSCDLNDAVGCVDVFNLLVKNDDVDMAHSGVVAGRYNNLGSADRQRARTAADRACEGGNAWGCRQAAMIASTRGEKSTALRKQCWLSAGNMDGC